MKISLTWRSLLAFMLLLFFLNEAHELVHTGLGRLLCGCWGRRDFNVWSLCADCSVGRPWNLAPTFVGPLFTFALGWWGYWLLDSRNSLPRRSLGFVLVFATMPFARILGAVFMGGNDEVYALSKLLPYHAAWALGAGLVLLATVPPLVRAYTALQSQGRIWVFLGFLLLPFALMVAVVLYGLNPLVASGFFATYGILGSPILVTSWTVLVGLGVGLMHRQLLTMGQPALGLPHATTVTFK